MGNTEKTEPKTDWATIIREIEASKHLKEVAQEVGISLPSLYDLRNGETADPRHSVGARILAIHKRELAKQARKAAYEARKQA